MRGRHVGVPVLVRDVVIAGAALGGESRFGGLTTKSTEGTTGARHADLARRGTFAAIPVVGLDVGQAVRLAVGVERRRRRTAFHFVGVGVVKESHLRALTDVRGNGHRLVLGRRREGSVCHHTKEESKEQRNRDRETSERRERACPRLRGVPTRERPLRRHGQHDSEVGRSSLEEVS